VGQGRPLLTELRAWAVRPSRIVVDGPGIYEVEAVGAWSWRRMGRSSQRYWSRHGGQPPDDDHHAGQREPEHRTGVPPLGAPAQLAEPAQPGMRSLDDHLRPPGIGVGTPAWRSGRSSPVGQFVAARLVVMAGIEVHGRLVGQRPPWPAWCQGGGQQRVVRSRRFAPLGKVTKLEVAWVLQGDHPERNVTTFSGLLPFCCQLAPQGKRGAALGWWACQDLNLGPHPYQWSWAGGPPRRMKMWLGRPATSASPGAAEPDYQWDAGASGTPDCCCEHAT
jgi:hypothetical protein